MDKESSNLIDNNLLIDIKNLVLKIPTEAKNFCFSEEINNQGPPSSNGEIFLKKSLNYNKYGILLVLVKIQEKYNVEIPYYYEDISLKDIYNYIVGH